jgi:ribonuclease BN (tRNA processing enzyme)
MKVTILGTGPACPGPGEACSGFLVEKNEQKILIDFGTGVISNLQYYCAITDVSSIVITHMHPDHFLDLIPFRYALRYSDIRESNSKPSLFLPPGCGQILDKVVLPFAESDHFFNEVMDVSEYDPDKPLVIGGLTLKFMPVKHYIPAWGVSIADSRKISYSTDSGICPELVTLAADSDLFICNAGANPDNDAVNWGHLQPEQAGILARKAEVKKLLVSHISRRQDKAGAFERASVAFGGDAELAKAGWSIEL